MNALEIVLYISVIVAMFGSIIGYIAHSRPATIGSFIFLVAVTVLWSVLELIGVFPK